LVCVCVFATAMADYKVWFKFAAGTGSHLLRVKNPGTEAQEVMLDGAILEAPPGTTTFTGPAATLLELQYLGEGQWTLLVDGREAELYKPEATDQSSQQICWWRFGISGTGTHHVRAADIGTSGQQVWIDGAPLDAPPGTMSFTGPGACLLELMQREDGQWMLLCDGYPLQQHNPANDSGEPSLCWQFALSTGHHLLAVRQVGKRGQQFYLDGADLQVPEGCFEFTGPGGVLLQLVKLDDGAWHLLAEGSDLGAGLASMEAADAPLQASFSFVLPATGSTHTVQAYNVGRQGQTIYLDGSNIEAPDGCTSFTGPAGSLLELKLQEGRWQLFVDNQSIAALSNRASLVPGPLSLLGQDRAPVSSEVALPQGVSFDAEQQRYTATIRVAGRFRNLGLFHSPDEAHQRYLEAKQELGQ